MGRRTRKKKYNTPPSVKESQRRADAARAAAAAARAEATVEDTKSTPKATSPPGSPNPNPTNPNSSNPNPKPANTAPTATYAAMLSSKTTEVDHSNDGASNGARADHDPSKAKENAHPLEKSTEKGPAASQKEQHGAHRW